MVKGAKNTWQSKFVSYLCGKKKSIQLWDYKQYSALRYNKRAKEERAKMTIFSQELLFHRRKDPGDIEYAW